MKQILATGDALWPKLFNNRAKKFIRIKREIVVEEDGKEARFLPHNGFKVAFAIDFALARYSRWRYPWFHQAG